MKSKGYLAVCLTFGYVESQSIGTVMFRNTAKDFKTEKEAIKSLAEDLRSIYHERVARRKKKKSCCLSATGNFCSTCGKSLEDEPEIDVEHFKEWLWGLLSSTNDSFGYTDYADDRDIYWEPTGPEILAQLNKEGYKCAFISEKAESEICDALGLDDEY